MAKKALVVDDKEEIRDIVRAALIRDGWEVLIASGGREGWNVVEENTPSLVVSDINMPDGSGEELCWRIKRVFIGVKVILMSGISDNVNLAFKAGADGFLGKPFSIKDLYSLVATVITESK